MQTCCKWNQDSEVNLYLFTLSLVKAVHAIELPSLASQTLSVPQHRSLSVSSLGLAALAPHLWIKRKFVYIFIYLFIYLYIYIYGTCVFRIYTSCPICARCNISTLHVGSCNHCCSREKTSRTERLNSGKQRNRNLKTVRKGRHYYQDGG